MSQRFAIGQCVRIANNRLVQPAYRDDHGHVVSYDKQGRYTVELGDCRVSFDSALLSDAFAPPRSRVSDNG